MVHDQRKPTSPRRTAGTDPSPATPCTAKPRPRDDFAAQIARAEFGRNYVDESVERELARHARANLRRRGGPA